MKRSASERTSWWPVTLNTSCEKEKHHCITLQSSPADTDSAGHNKAASLHLNTPVMGHMIQEILVTRGSHSVSRSWVRMKSWRRGSSGSDLLWTAAKSGGRSCVQSESGAGWRTGLTMEVQQEPMRDTPKWLNQSEWLLCLCFILSATLKHSDSNQSDSRPVATVKEAPYASPLQTRVFDCWSRFCLLMVDDESFWLSESFVSKTGFPSEENQSDSVNVRVTSAQVNLETLWWLSQVVRIPDTAFWTTGTLPLCLLVVISLVQHNSQTLVFAVKAWRWRLWVWKVHLHWEVSAKSNSYLATINESICICIGPHWPQQPVCKVLFTIKHNKIL